MFKHIDFRIRKTQVKFLVLFTCCLYLTNLPKLFDSVFSSVKLEIKNNHLIRFLREFRKKMYATTHSRFSHTDVLKSNFPMLIQSLQIYYVYCLFAYNFNCHIIIISQSRREVLEDLQSQAEMQWCWHVPRKHQGPWKAFTHSLYLEHVAQLFQPYKHFYCVVN